MTIEYSFSAPITNMTYHAQSWAKVSDGAVAISKVNDDSLTVGIGGTAEISLEGLKCFIQTPLAMSIGLQLNISWEWKGGLHFEYDGIGADIANNRDYQALAETVAIAERHLDSLMRLKDAGAIDMSIRSLLNRKAAISIS